MGSRSELIPPNFAEEGKNPPTVASQFKTLQLKEEKWQGEEGRSILFILCQGLDSPPAIRHYHEPLNWLGVGGSIASSVGGGI